MTEQDKREKVIKGLEICLNEFVNHDGCPYYTAENEACGGWDVFPEPLLKDALELLKAQEPVEPKKNDVEMCGLRTWDWACPVCNTILLYKANYCSGCGTAVKWDG